jgi:hypothetical protein
MVYFQYYSINKLVNLVDPGALSHPPETCISVEHCAAWLHLMKCIYALLAYRLGLYRAFSELSIKYL